jgi:hypothetical protein
MALHNGTQLANMAIGGFLDAGVLSRIVTKDAEFAGVAGKGSTVNVRRIGKDTADNFAGTATASTSTEGTTAVTLSHQPYIQRSVLSADKVLKVEDYFAQIVAPSIGGVAEYIDETIADLLATTTATQIKSTVAKTAIINARKFLSQKKVPMSDRYLACSPAFVAAILGETWIQADSLGDNGTALREGVIGRAFGFWIVESTHVADIEFGTAGADPTAYAFHKSGVLMASRALAAPEGGAKGGTAAAFGMTARVVEDWSSTALSDVLTVDTLFGVAKPLDQDVDAPDGSAFDEDHRVVPVGISA